MMEIVIYFAMGVSMTKRLSMMLLWIIAASLFILPARAADAAWTAWLYENEIGRVTQIDSTGTTLKQFQLPNEASGQYSQHIVISADGLLMAYATLTDSANTVQILDLTTNNVVYTFDAPANASLSFDFSGGTLNFDENHQFAFGYGGVGIPWKIIVIDVPALSVSSLKQEDPISASLSALNGYFMPTVAYNRGKEIKFMMIPLGTDGAPMYPAYTWNREANTITPTNDYITPDTSTFVATKEVITTLSDVRFPESQMPLTGFPANNTLQVFDAATNQRSIVTALPRIYDPEFIQSGERVVVTRYDDLGDGPQIQVLEVLERSGGLSGVVNGQPPTGIIGVLGTPDGFIFAAASGGDPKAGGTTLYNVRTRGATAPYNAVSLWNSALGATARLVWVSTAENANPAALPVWGKINPPVATPVPSDGSGISMGDGAYRIGVIAQVQTTDNDVLNLRNGPGLNFPRLGTIPSGTMVTLIDGPQNADGLIWWKVRLPNGTEGWVVSSVDGINTLLPRS